jgi:hypothetical protein
LRAKRSNPETIDNKLDYFWLRPRNDEEIHLFGHPQEASISIFKAKKIITGKQKPDYKSFENSPDFSGISFNFAP